MDALLGGIEVLRNDLALLIEMSQGPYPDIAERLECMDDDLVEILDSFEPGEEELWFTEDEDLALFQELQDTGMLSPADIDYFGEEED